MTNPVFPSWLSALSAAALVAGLAAPAAAAAPTRAVAAKAGPAALKSKLTVVPAKAPKPKVPRPAAPAKPPSLPNPYKEPCPGVESLGKRAGDLPFQMGEELAYEITVSGAFVGRMEMKVGKPRKVEGKIRVPLFARARTSDFVATFKAFEGRYMAMVDPHSLDPLGVRTESTYGDEPRWERIRFSDDHRSVGADVLLEGRELRREYASEHALTDLLTLLYQARMVSVQPGLKACQDVFASRRLWRMTASVDEVVPVDTPAGERDTYLVKTAFDRKPTHGLNNNVRPHMEVDVYLAADASQAPLQFVIRAEGVEAVAKLVRWSTKGGSEQGWGFADAR